MSKRSAEELEVTSTEDDVTKRLKPDEDHPEGSWTCGSCYNVNWPKRTKCNRQGCNMPRLDQMPDAETGGAGSSTSHPEGSWACLGCGNINWPKRTTCNKPTCRMSRSGTPGAGAGGPMMGMGMRMPPAFRAMSAPTPSLGSHPPGSWACTCGNVNWPQRTTCNKKSCGQNRPANAGDVGGQQQQLPGMGMGAVDPMQAYYNQYNNPYGPSEGGMGGMGGMGMGGLGMNIPGMEGLGGMGGMGMGAYGMDAAQQALLMAGVGMGEGVGSQHPPGSWACSKCTNVNWPKRTTCNSKGCGANKPTGAGGISGGMSGMPAASNGGAGNHPEGSWECPGCQNVNWPKRTTCNKAGCETPRPM